LRLRTRLLLRCGPSLRLRLRTLLRLGLRTRLLRLRCGSRLRLWAHLLLRLGLRTRRLGLRCGSRLGLRLRAYLRLRLGWTVLRLLGTHLRLSRTRLRLAGSRWLHLRLSSGLTGSGLRLTGAVFRLAGSRWLHLRLIAGLAGSGLRLTGAAGLSGSGLGLSRTIRRLARTVGWLIAEVGPRDARLRGDRSCGDGNGGTALVLVEELLTVRGRLALVLELGGHGRGTGSAHGSQFRRLRPYVEAASAAVVGDAVAHVAILNRTAVDVVDT
jgi:hypothetical protein